MSDEKDASAPFICTGCGETFEKIDDRFTVLEGNEVRCPACKTLTDCGWAKCGSCGRKFLVQLPVEKGRVTCSECGAGTEVDHMPSRRAAEADEEPWVEADDGAVRPLSVFPSPPVSLEEAGSDREEVVLSVRAYIAHAEGWQWELISFLRRLERDEEYELEGEAAHLRRKIVPFPDDPAPEEPEFGFPELPRESPPAGRMFEVLKWRARIVDFLDDVWDVMGEPAIGIEEAGQLAALFDPVFAHEACRYCLMRFPSDKRDPFAHGCAVLAALHGEWPDDFPGLAGGAGLL